MIAGSASPPARTWGRSGRSTWPRRWRPCSVSTRRPRRPAPSSPGRSRLPAPQRDGSVDLRRAARRQQGRGAANGRSRRFPGVAPRIARVQAVEQGRERPREHERERGSHRDAESGDAEALRGRSAAPVVGRPGPSGWRSRASGPTRSGAGRRTGRTRSAGGGDREAAQSSALANRHGASARSTRRSIVVTFPRPASGSKRRSSSRTAPASASGSPLVRTTKWRSPSDT